MKNIMSLIGLYFTALVLTVLISLIPTFVWYGMDDWLADFVGWPILGEVPFWRIFGLFILANMLFTDSNYKSDSDSDSK